MKIIQLTENDEYWEKVIDFAEQCSWSNGLLFADLLKRKLFSDWETVFIAVENDDILGFCSFSKKSYPCEISYSPCISSVFVRESQRGRRLGQKLIENVVEYARKCRFCKIYIASEFIGYFEKCGFRPICEISSGKKNGHIFMRYV